MNTDNTSCPLSILIIDDSSSERAQIKAKLSALGHHAIEVDSGYKALDYMSENMGKVDLIILDMQMPGMNGLETARSIRAMEKQHAEEWRPIMFLSGRTDAKMIAQGIEAGGDDYLTKPIDTIILKAKITAMHRIVSMRQRLILAKEQLEIIAHTDELTQIPNLRHFNNILNSEIDRAHRFNMPLCIAYVDLDHFKLINDTHGHPAGDIVLQSVTDLLAKNLRSVDNIGRVGGEEFCLCLPGTDIKDALAACERYRLLIENLSIATDSQTLNVTASFGVTSFIPNQDDANSLMIRADKALYLAKENGRNRIEVIYPWDSTCLSVV